MKRILWSLILLLIVFSAYSQPQMTYYVYNDVVKDTVALEESVIYGSLRATNTTPFSFTNVTKPTLEILPGAEVAYALSTTPSITFYSDNGSNLGYVYYRLRGIDQSRLNVTLNGVPLNEPEDQGSYFNNFPNFLSAIGNVQIIRGAGLSKVGTSTFGGSLNFETKSDYGSDPFKASASYGSYGTQMIQAEVNTNKFFIGAAHFVTDGYKYTSGNVSTSVNYGADFNLFGQKTKWFGMVGKQENGMAWVGETLDQISVDPRSNTNKKGERDNFFNTHNQLTFENTSIRNSKITYTIFHQYQSGWYDTDISLFDPTLKEAELMSRIQLKFHWLGGIYNQSYTYKNLKINFGASYNIQHRNHEGLSNFQQSGFVTDYTNLGVKQEFAQYIKGEYRIKYVTFYGDVQNRYVNYKYKSPDFNHTLYNKTNINYSAGASYKKGNNILHYGFGQSTREPRRSDILGGVDNYSGSLNNLNDETVNSRDLGYKYVSNKLEFGVNLYDMQFKNEFMPNGYGENGITLYTNVVKSYRKGVELYGKFVGERNELSFNGTLSKNKFINADETWTNSILSPARVASINLMHKVGKIGYIGVIVRTNSKAYIDLTNSYQMPAYTVLDGYAGIKGRTLELRLNVNNLTNSLILTNGAIGFDGNPRYFVMNKFASLLTLKIKI